MRMVWSVASNKLHSPFQIHHALTIMHTFRQFFLTNLLCKAKLMEKRCALVADPSWATLLTAGFCCPKSKQWFVDLSLLFAIWLAYVREGHSQIGTRLIIQIMIGLQNRHPRTVVPVKPRIQNSLHFFLTFVLWFFFKFVDSFLIIFHQGLFLLFRSKSTNAWSMLFFGSVNFTLTFSVLNNSKILHERVSGSKPGTLRL